MSGSLASVARNQRPSMPELRIEIPGVPPTNNHYKSFRVMPTRNGKSVPNWYHTAKAKEWFAAAATGMAGGSHFQK